MGRRIMHVWGLALALVLLAGSAQAVSLGKVDVASHLGEPFFAEVALDLDEGEKISGVFVEMAAPSDYRILEVYRDAALNQIRAEVKSDSRGQRVELTSDSVIESPFFNLVLKVRYERATHFKKYPVFLDLPRAAKPVAGVQPPQKIDVVSGEVSQAPVVTPVQSVSEGLTEDEMIAEGAESFLPYDNWARTGRYGPMVFGDTITTVAQRLRVDERFTNEQVMVALFEKNRNRFDQDNINLIKAGTYLDVPSSAEVERISPQQASATLASHEKTWRQLTQQPRYAAVEEAQRTRYSKRVMVGEQASGVAAAPMTGDSTEESALPVEQDAGSVEGKATDTGSAAGHKEGGAADAALAAELEKLQKQNEELQAKLKASQEEAAKATAAVKAGSPEAQAAMQAKLDRLEIQLKRMQAERDRAQQEAASAGDAGVMDLVAYGLGGVVVLLLGAIAYLLRRERPHPAQYEQMEDQGFDDSDFAAPDMSYEVPDVDVPELPVEEVSVGQDATAKMSAEEFEDSFGSDSIPDLTDEDTSEMEAFQEESEEEPDPNVDYLSEADVYLRYGMEDEAEKQVRMALRLREDNKDAHVKLVEVCNARGDSAGAAAAADAARGVLTGAALEAFEEAIASGGGASDAGESSLEDTVSPSSDEDAGLDLGGMDFGGLGDSGAEDAGEPDSGELDMGDMDFSLGDATDEEPEAAAEESSSDGLDMGDLDVGGLDFSLGDTDEPEEAPAAEPASEVPDSGELDMGSLDMGDMDFSLGDEEASEPVAEAETDEVGATEELDVGGLDFDLSADDGAGESAESMDLSEETVALGGETDSLSMDDSMGDLDFDLGDLDASSGAEIAESSEVKEPAIEEPDDDMDKTVVMDWSSETVLASDDDVGGESGAQAVASAESEDSSGGLDFDLGDDFSSDLDALSSGGSDSVIEEPEGSDASLDVSGDGFDFDLGELDADLASESPASDSEPDDFTSSVKTTFDMLTGDSDSSAEESASTSSASDDDLGSIGDLDMGVSTTGSFDLDSSENDFDATAELDSLLSELGGIDDDSVKAKPAGDDSSGDEDDNPFKI